MSPEDLMSLFVPHLLERAAPIIAGKRLVHYTSAEAAYKIISGREVWLRNSHLMNDYSEMRHGLTCLQAAWGSPAGIKLQNWLDERWTGLRNEVLATFDSHADGLTNSTFLMSLSEHDDDEDYYGRLSMWRAYGARAGVALVLNPQIFLSDSEAMHVFSAPVIYRDVAAFVEWFEHWVVSLIDAQDRMSSLGREIISGTIFYAFRTFVLATKHPGFLEEKEWRVFHSPILDGESSWLKYDIEIVGGVPQHIVKVALRDDLNAGVEGVEPSKLINRVIIGPCESPLPIRNALNSALISADVSDVAEKVWMSFIPLRQR